ncbi:hypothetical protein DFO67_102171 [Modicisalibacter xianhensis]|uniref:Cytochrome c domain-containing protein n=1 Tax=Modicisalibacter xianhensis TaxID=442341 RepID=A0A4R8G9M1_9GAMM|nr:cytochrome c [Halomonas xianhensis]TDX32222.1 hypothetical protein DFO67_102171 [Halomonas xianhensis]
MKITNCRRLSGLAVALFLSGPVTSLAAEPGSDQTLVERGRYIVTVSGCNDCHTPGYGLASGEIPESLWLTGDRLGWHGEWGTTYASNLRLLAAQLNETQWVSMTRTLKARPPMPWFNLNRMSVEDSRAVYHYLRALGPAGETAPSYLPPGTPPTPPYIAFPTSGT